MNSSTVKVSKKILGISLKHEKKAVGLLCLEWKKTKQLGEVRQKDPFQWKLRNYNFDHLIFHVTFRNISNFHAFSFRNTRFGCKLDFDQRCDPSGWSQVHKNLISLLIHDEIS